MRLALALVLAAAAPTALAQELAVSAGPAHLTSETPRDEDFGRTGLALSAHVALWPRAPVVPVVAVYHARFSDAREGTEGGGLLLYAWTAGVRAQPFRDGPVRPYGRVGLGLGRRAFPETRFPGYPDATQVRRSYGSLAGDVALGAAVGGGDGPFGYVEAGSVAGGELFSTSTHYGVRAGAGYRF